ncbi:hypothetical protein BU23DRAFT_645366 [Bimuria novae-zelandiae CBS 107.79]|uniref:Aminoglycoside phosphotransferase domain-containing protein n=1 Tax=Bimuria novae-zelandiae CBS 107.79 TaxID=1447943 RepID=A0A6A5V7N1_9PLEO|nr:hypothetical protein BU23DRAFT_645366 [Bimuria novae-zelandiae CBS 107.79]
MSSFTDDHIVSLCHNPMTTILSSPLCLNKVARISNDVAVKFGQFVTVQEFKNQQIAQQSLDSDIVTVPRAYRFFQKEDAGYIIMDYVAGKTLDLESAKEVVKELGEVLNHIHQHEGMNPGHLEVGQCLVSSGQNMKRWISQSLMTSISGSIDRAAQETRSIFVTTP